jgi:hypothetical protein
VVLSDKDSDGSDEEAAGGVESGEDVEAEPIPDELASEAPDVEDDAGDATPRFQLDADSERRRAAPREERISESRLFETGDDDPRVDEDPPEPRTRAEELRALGKDRPGPDEEAPREAREPPPAADRDAPVVIPARDEMDLPVWRRHWKPIAAAIALLLVAILAVRGVGGGGGGATPDQGASPDGAEAASAVDVDRAEALIDSLEAALGRYRERRQDFDLDRLDCAGLTRGYEEVRSALGELRSAVPYAEDLAAGSLRSSYRSLVSSVETVEEGYAETGCADSA